MLTPKQLKEKLKGVAVVNVTPFFEDGKVDYEGYRENLRFTIEKLKGQPCTITPCGSNGEFSHMNEEENRKIIEICIEEVNGRFPVIAGAGRASTHETILASQHAQAAGADGVQIILPFYFVPTEEGMYLHYKKLADALDIGIVIYNNPAFSKSWIKPKLLKQILDNTDGKICGIKENTPHLMLFNSLAKMLKDTDVSLHSGFGEQWYAYQFPWGADGFVTPFGNFFPEYPLKFYAAAQKYDFETMRSLLAMMDPYYNFVAKCSAARPDTGVMVKPGGAIYGEGNVRFSIIKEAMNLMGLRGGHMRLPLLGINDKERDELKEVLRALKLI